MNTVMNLSTATKNVLLLALFSFTIATPITARAATAPNLGVATGYSVFGNAGITETAGQTSHLWGNAGGNGFGFASLIAGQVDGSIDVGANVPVVGAIASAYGDLAGEAATGAFDLAGTNTVTPGVYTVGATTLNGTLTLNGSGVYIFRSSSSISTSGAARVRLINGATACNVFWQIPTSMTIGANSEIIGTIITNTGLISFANGANLQGRAWASTQVTMDNNQITEPTCTASATESTTIRVTKEASKANLLSGPAKVKFTYRVTNRGDVALSDISVKDDKCDDVNYVSGDDNDDDLLDTDENWKYNCKKTVRKTETNTVTAKGTANGDRVRDTDTAKVTVSTPGLPATGVNAPYDTNRFWSTGIQSLSSFFSSLVR